MKAELIKSILDEYGIDGYYQPSIDEFFSEYSPSYLNRLYWLTGFTGSNGSVIITKEKIVFFTDGRYTEQAKIQLGSDVEIFDIKDKNPSDYAKEHNLNLGINPKLLPYRHKFQQFTSTEDLVDKFWQRDKYNIQPVYFFYEQKYTGSSYQEKLSPLLDLMMDHDFSHYILTDPDLICWLTSLRGNDQDYTPLVLAYAIIDISGIINIYLNSKETHLTHKKMRFLPLEKFSQDIKLLARAGFDPETSSIETVLLLGEKGDGVKNPLLRTRGIKHSNEIEYAGRVHIEDGIAMCKLLSWVESNAASKQLSEIDVAEKSEKFRRESKNFFSLSFPTIAGFAENSAIIHYKPEKETAKLIKGDGILLIDSGGQYFGGTTDITRTIVFNATDRQKHLYTLVLMGHIDVAAARFSPGTNGKIFDEMARKYLQAEGLDYPHSTGHGVGNFLGVHETPPGFSSRGGDALSPGMIISNEPGFYLPGEFGIRIENLLSIVQAKDIFAMEDLTLIPHEEKLIDCAMLTDAHKLYLKNYYIKIGQMVEPHIDCSRSKKWLEAKLSFCMKF